ncbi:MAG: dihydropteroate synthase [Cyclobacteriaceae bacterium]
MQSKVFSTNKTLNLGGRLLDLSTPKLMGILNVTPDSFYDGDRYPTVSSALSRAEQMIAEGAQILDVGGYSSRPGASDISEKEESDRVIPVIKSISQQFPDIHISCDTFRSGVAQKAIDVGAQMINDISAGQLDHEMTGVIARHNIPYVVMHMKGTPQTMKSLAVYNDILQEVSDYFLQKVHTLKGFGVKDVIIDPGFGFAKTVDQNFELIKKLELLKIHEQPLLVGLSRKSLIWKTLQTTPENALNGTTALNAIALLKGADILRIHDVKEAAEAVKLINFVR